MRPPRSLVYHSVTVTMQRRRESLLPAEVSPDWLIRARRSDQALSSDKPLIAEVTSRSGPSPLVVDIHDGIEVGIVLEGCAERHFQDFFLTGSPGDVWLCAMWELHGRRVLAEQTSNVVLMFLPEFLGEEMLGDRSWLSVFAAPPPQRPWALTPEVREQVIAIGRELQHEITQRPRYWESAVRINLVRLLFQLSRDWDPPALRAGARSAGTNLTRIMPALTLLRTEPDRRVTLAEAASACRLSPTRFSVVFQHTLGTSFSKFALRGRLAFVARLLLSTHLSIEDVAAAAGFVDASHLHRTFVRQYGCTPGQYRQQAEGACPK